MSATGSSFDSCIPYIAPLSPAPSTSHSLLSLDRPIAHKHHPDNCRLLFPTDPDITIVTSPSGQYVVSLAQHPPKILLDLPTASRPHSGAEPELHTLYVKTQIRVAEVVASMKSSVPTSTAATTLPSRSRSPGSSLAALSARITAAQIGARSGDLGAVPFPRFPLQLRGAKTGGGGGGGSDGPVHEAVAAAASRCCAHGAELAEERARRRKAERKVKELEAMLRVVMKGVQSINEDDEVVVVPSNEEPASPTARRPSEPERPRMKRDSKSREREARAPDGRASGGSGGSSGDQNTGPSRTPSLEGSRYAIEMLEYP